MMKKIAKSLLVALVAVIGVVLTSCNPEPEAKKFSLQFTGYGPGYVSVNVTVPGPTTVAYTVLDFPDDLMLDPVMLTANADANTTFYTDGPQQLLDYPIEENTKYYVYLVAALGDDYSQVYTYEFETEEFTFSQLATVVGVTPDGYKMYIQVPESVKTSQHGAPGSKAIRYAQGDLMIYNFYKTTNDDTYSMLYNGGKYLTEDSMVEFSDALNYGEAGADINEDGKVDENDISILWNPIAPGEPVVFLAGEFEWMSEPADYKKGGAMDGKTYFVNGFPFPGGWEDGYYLPCVDGTKYWPYYGKNVDGTDKEDDETENGEGTEGEDTGSADAPSTPATRGAGIINNIDLTSPIDAFWTGAFQRKVFRTRVPAKLDGDFEVKVENLRSVDASLTITPTENVYRYLFTVLDDGAYNQMLELLDGKTEYVQWAVTSYFAMYNFGQIQVAAEAGTTSAPAIEFNLTDFFFDVPSDTKYHVLITGMSGDIGSPQCFKHYTFSTPAKTKTRGPNIVVTPMPDESEPYEAVFNVKCTSVANNRAVRCYYGANYKMEWIHKVNSSSSYTYEYLGQTNEFTAAELSQINSEEGLTLRIPTIDGETTRLVVVAFNDENISNGIDKKEDPTEHPAVADCTTPFAKAKIERNPLLDTDELVDYWTMTATVLGGKQMSQKVAIKRQFIAGVDYPADDKIPADVKEIYKKTTKWTDDEIQGYYEEFKTIAQSYNKDRLRNQNRLLIEGWIDDSQGTLSYLSPWDLFKHEKISMADVSSMFARFGPKIYLNVNKAKDGSDSLAISANKMFVSPIAQWSVPFYMAGRRSDKDESNTIFQWSDDYGNWVGALTFPVTLAEDHNTITIHALENAGVKYYPNLVGISEGLGGATTYILENPIISDVVLTRGWTEPETPEAEPETPGESETPATRSVRSASRAVSPIGNPEFVKYSDMSDFSSVRKRIVMDGEVVTYEKLQENFEKFRKAQSKRMR